MFKWIENIQKYREWKKRCLDVEAKVLRSRGAPITNKVVDATDEDNDAYRKLTHGVHMDGTLVEASLLYQAAKRTPIDHTYWESRCPLPPRNVVTTKAVQDEIIDFFDRPLLPAYPEEHLRKLFTSRDRENGGYVVEMLQSRLCTVFHADVLVKIQGRHENASMVIEVLFPDEDGNRYSNGPVLRFLQHVNLYAVPFSISDIDAMFTANRLREHYLNEQRKRWVGNYVKDHPVSDVNEEPITWCKEPMKVSTNPPKVL